MSRLFTEGDITALLHIASKIPRPNDRARLRLIASKIEVILNLPDEDQQVLERARELYRQWLTGGRADVPVWQRWLHRVTKKT